MKIHYFHLNLPQMLTRPPDNAPNEAPIRFLLFFIGEMYWPSSLMSPVFAKRKSFGMRYLSNITKPLSSAFKPIFSPKSPTVTPANGCRVFRSRIGTKNAFNPWCWPSAVYNWAYTIAWVAVLPFERKQKNGRNKR